MGKPLIISTGMANLDEIGAALDAARNAGARDIVLLHCISGYPAPVEETNLFTIPDLEKRFGVIVGLSDHTMGTAVSVASVALGAHVIEKHFTLNKSDGGPDVDFSLEPQELAELCSSCHVAWSALGQPNYDRKDSEKGNAVFRRSLYVIQDIVEGEVFTPENVRSIRPGYGLPPVHLPDVLGKTAAVAIKRGTPLKWTCVRGEGVDPAG